MIEIMEYQERWPSEFQAIASTLRQGLGKLALRIDHIGSTSVLGLAAKDIVDIQVTVARLDEPVISAMTALGYRLPEGVWRDHAPPHFVAPDSHWEKLFFRPPLGQRPTNTHLRIEGRANQRYALLFRDYLRAHPATAEAYARLKRGLAQHLPNSETYSNVKDPAVDLIYFPAEKWAAETGWQQGATDG